MVAAKMSAPSLAETYRTLCSFLKENPKLTVVVSNHIAAKHKIHSLPAFHTTDAISDDEKLVTYGEIVRAIVKKNYSSLKGQIASGQAQSVDEPKQAEPNLTVPAEAMNPLPRRDSVLPKQTAPTAAVPEPVAETAQPDTELLLNSEPARWCRKPSDIEDAFAMAFGADKGDGYFSHPEPFVPSNIIETKHLTPSEFDAFCASFYTERDWLTGKGGHRSKDRKLLSYSAILVVAPDRPRILVNPEGFNYGRYIGLFEADKDTWQKRLHGPSGEEKQAQCVPGTRPLNPEELHTYLDLCIEAAKKIPGSCITVQISLPTHC
jgi:hypothetical protein